MKAQLPVNATLLSISQNLKCPEEFVRSVFANMRGGRDEMGMRVALDSNPAFPDYCIEMYFEERNSLGNWEIVGSQFLAAFSGRNHKELPAENSNTRPWSNDAMSWAHVQMLLGEIRGIRRGFSPYLR